MTDQPHQPHGVTCTAEGCGRTFLDQAALNDHAEAVHTYDERRQMVRLAIQAFLKDKLTISRTIWVYVRDMTDDWAVFEVDGSDDLLRITYTVSDGGTVAIAGDPVKVRARVVYEAITAEAGA